jgi:hypothetical protein
LFYADPMKKLYTHENRMIIFNLKNVMQGEGINVIVMNEYSSGGAGDLATFDTWPELWVEDDSQFDRAEVILKQIVSNPKDEFWFCRGCQEKNDVAFKLCWNCGHSIE